MIRIIGRNKCNGTKKAIRYFKERNIPFQFMNLDERMLSSGELKNIFRLASPEELLDKNSKEYKKRGMEFMEYDTATELFEDQQLLKTPIIIDGKKINIG